MTFRDKFESGSRNNWMYYTYAASILQFEKKSSRESELRYYQRLMAAQRPTFQQFVDYLLRTEVDFQFSWIHMQKMTILSICSRILLFPCERLQHPLATVLDPLSYLFLPVWHYWKVWNHWWGCSTYTRCEGLSVCTIIFLGFRFGWNKRYPTGISMGQQEGHELKYKSQLFQTGRFGEDPEAVRHLPAWLWDV